MGAKDDIATERELVELRSARLRNDELMGRQAAIAGKPATDNPYGREVVGEQARAWQAGWKLGAREIGIEAPAPLPSTSQPSVLAVAQITESADRAIVSQRVVIAHLLLLMPHNETHGISCVRVTRLANGWRIADRDNNNAVEHTDHAHAAADIGKRVMVAAELRADKERRGDG